MSGVALLKRTDTKYVLNTAHALAALDCLREDYLALEVAGTRLQRYRTQYFDTETLALYLRHHAGNAVRYKVRSRAYLDSGHSFIEVKRKDNRDWTTKHRAPTAELLARLTPDARAFVREHFPLPDQILVPTLQNDFFRITLVSKRHPERLTMDLDIRFARPGSAVELPDVVIAELKQHGINRASEFVQVMRALNLHPTGISKYCVGVALLYGAVNGAVDLAVKGIVDGVAGGTPNGAASSGANGGADCFVKHNNIKPKLRLLERAVGGEHAWRRA
jgi:hypothetical protein